MFGACGVWPWPGYISACRKCLHFQEPVSASPLHPSPHFSKGWSCLLPHDNMVGFTPPPSLSQALYCSPDLRAAQSFHEEVLSGDSQASQRCSPGLAKEEQEGKQGEWKDACCEVDGAGVHCTLSDIRQIKSSSHLFYFSQVFLSKIKIRCFSLSPLTSAPQQMVTNTHLM